MPQQTGNCGASLKSTAQVCSLLKTKNSCTAQAVAMTEVSLTDSFITS